MRAIALLLLAGAALAASSPKPKEAASAYVQTGRFRCRLPPGWSRSTPSSTQDIEKVYGVEATAAESVEGARVAISVDHYAADNTLQKSTEAYIAAHGRRDPALRLPGEKYGAPSDTRIGARPARSVERETFLFWPPEDPKARRIPMREKFIVLPAGEGFFALRYSAPSALFEKYAPAFQAVAESFVPLR